MRNENAAGSNFPEFREDWVFRGTYNFASKYFFEVNGAYNGSQIFGPDYRFDFFPSAAAGWTITNEKFMQDINWLTSLKLRGSYGLVGNDVILPSLPQDRSVIEIRLAQYLPIQIALRYLLN